ncbi:type Z 30S ribosomal protein S14 [Candidatus Peregrinibacteria bacterium]|nr:type Z 30S ribosomal protein S14 [Candidatus Peregrinibacteria bacterium]
MARTALKISTEKREKAYLKALSTGKKPRFPTRIYHRCKLCGRGKGYMIKFSMCRICFRENARKGMIPGVKKSSW